MRFNFLIILFCFASYSLFASDINIEKENTSYIGKNISYFEDVDSTYDINKIKQMDTKNFTRYDKKAFISFFTNSTFWLKFNLLNSSEKTLKRYFVFDAPWIDTINIYIYDEKNKLTTYKLGTLLPFKERSMKINLLNQSHDFSKGKFIVYLQIKTRDPFIIPLSILSEKSFYEKIINKDLVETTTYSVVAALFIFNFLIFLITRYKTYFYYSLYLVSYLIMSLGYDSYTFKYIFYDYPNIQNWMQSIPILFYLMSSILFAKFFLELKENLPKVNRYTNNILIFHMAMIGLTSILGYQATIFYATSMTPLFSIYMFYLGVYSYLKGNKKALFFILATAFGCTGAFFTAVVNLPLIDYNWYLFKGVDIGIMIDSILFSIALAYRYTTLNLILEKTKNEVIELNENLEEKIHERTKKLNVEIRNKTVLLKELSHRVKNNLQVISALLSMDKNKMQNDEDKIILEENIKRIKSMSILYESFLEIENTMEIDLKNYIEKLILEFQKSFTDFKIDIKLDSEKIELDQKYLIPIGLVINELLINSIKYAFKEDNAQINISAFNKENNFNLVYKDNGVGVDIKKLKNGFGFGLINSLISYQLKGNVECENNNGLKYIITLPN